MTAFTMPVERGAVEEFDPIRISPSRVNQFLQCGVAFERKYIKGERPTTVGSAAVFGNVMHLANENWSQDRSQDMVSLTHWAWMELSKGTPVAKFIEQYQVLSIEAMKTEAAVKKEWEAMPQNKGKTSKAPRMTSLWKKSPVAAKIDKLLTSWLPRMNEDSPWHFTESDPLPSLYDESLILAKRYARKWNTLPPALHTEFGFTVEWNGFVLRGYIDAIEPVNHGAGYEGYQIVDFKTYRQDPPAAKDWRQGVIYDIAFDKLCQSGALPYDPDLPRWVVWDYMRLLKRRDYFVTPEDREKLRQELTMYLKAVEGGIFLPADKNMRVDFCDFPEDCCQKQRGEGTGCRGDLYPEDEDEK